MTTLANDRSFSNIGQWSDKAVPDFFPYPVATNILIYSGALVMKNAGGYATKGAVATNQVALGIADSRVDNTGGANGAKEVKVRRGVFPMFNSAAGDAITIADVGSLCYIVDDQTVAKTDGVGTRSAAGKIVGVKDGFVWVSIGVW